MPFSAACSPAKLRFRLSGEPVSVRRASVLTAFHFRSVEVDVLSAAGLSLRSVLITVSACSIAAVRSSSVVVRSVVETGHGCCCHQESLDVLYAIRKTCRVLLV